MSTATDPGGGRTVEACRRVAASSWASVAERRRVRVGFLAVAQRWSAILVGVLIPVDQQIRCAETSENAWTTTSVATTGRRSGKDLSVRSPKVARSPQQMPFYAWRRRRRRRPDRDAWARPGAIPKQQPRSAATPPRSTSRARRGRRSTTVHQPPHRPRAGFADLYHHPLLRSAAAAAVAARWRPTGAANRSGGGGRRRWRTTSAKTENTVYNSISVHFDPI